MPVPWCWIQTVNNAMFSLSYLIKVSCLFSDIFRDVWYNYVMFLRLQLLTWALCELPYKEESAANRLELKYNILCFSVTDRGKKNCRQRHSLRLWVWPSLFHIYLCVHLCVGVCVSRSAKEAEEKIKKALDKGEVLPTEARFDSNCITPGKEDLKLHAKMLTDTDQNHLIQFSAWMYFCVTVFFFLFFFNVYSIWYF